MNIKYVYACLISGLVIADGSLTWHQLTQTSTISHNGPCSNVVSNNIFYFVGYNTECTIDEIYTKKKSCLKLVAADL